ncbi:MAG TPA: hypothetical protein VFI27_05120 [candidate division Zixibacteria bacterium]|nr:hypothetical protein [candidate division Zixibacteria bacterium]
MNKTGLSRLPGGCFASRVEGKASGGDVAFGFWGMPSRWPYPY